MRRSSSASGATLSDAGDNPVELLREGGCGGDAGRDERQVPVSIHVLPMFFAGSLFANS